MVGMFGNIFFAHTQVYYSSYSATKELTGVPECLSAHCFTIMGYILQSDWSLFSLYKQRCLHCKLFTLTSCVFTENHLIGPYGYYVTLEPCIS